MMTTESPLVSVIVPTYNRPQYYERLYACFTQQHYPNKELLILDDSPEVSYFYQHLNDDRVRYAHTLQRLSIGEKRQHMLAVAKGSIIAHFDDDDFYSPQYLTFMVNALGSDNALVKLSNWFAYADQHRSFYYWDTTQRNDLHLIIEPNSPVVGVNGHEYFGPDFIEDNLWGYGFSYVYRKNLYPTIGFGSNDNWGEDIHFLQKVGQAGHTCKAFPDTQGLVMHIIHSNNTSRMFPQFRIPPFVITQLFPSSLKDHLSPPEKAAPLVTEPEII